MKGEPDIKILPEKKLIGLHLTMSMADNKTYVLWKQFMPRRSAIINNLTTELISMQVFDPSIDFERFDLHAPFEKWAAVEVEDFDSVPAGMETFLLGSGLYAVFLYKGAASAGAQMFQYIFNNWLPHSDYELENRPHFEILGEKYKNEDPDSEEEIWIPVKAKARP